MPVSRRLIAGLLFLTAACVSESPVEPSGPALAAGALGDRYIVVLKDHVADVAGVAGRHGAAPDLVYQRALRGFSAVMPARMVDALRSDPNVAFVEKDQPMYATAQTIPYGITKVGADVSSTQAGNASGAVSNVNVYIIDTGADTRHGDLNVVRHVSFAGSNRDCHGHGTHVAGTASAKDNTQDVVGVAPGAPITAVKVLNCFGSGSTSGVIQGIDWVTANRVLPAVANMSLGGGTSDALDQAVRNSVAAGVFYAVAAGNDGVDACNQSPARAGAGTNNGIMTVAATDANDVEASWSNYGPCVDVWAPGVSILSTKRNGGTTTMSGTSMASPHVAGGGALYLSGNTGASPTAVEAALRSAAQTTGTTSKDGAAIKRLWVGGF